MKKTIIMMTLLAGFSFAGQLDYTTEQINDVIADGYNQYGASGYSSSTNVVVDGTNWTNMPGSFTIPLASGFEYVSASTMRYTNGGRWFLLIGSASIDAGAVGTRIEIGIETNGVPIEASSSGQRLFAQTGDEDELNYHFPVYMSSNDTVGVIIKGDASQTITINKWQSTAIRF